MSDSKNYSISILFTIEKKVLKKIKYNNLDKFEKIQI